MSYTQNKPNTTRFTLLSRVSTTTLNRSTFHNFQAITTLGGPSTTYTQPAGSLIIGELRTSKVNLDPAVEWEISGGVFTVRALDQMPNALSTVAGSPYSCTIANGVNSNQIYVTSGGNDVNETLMTNSHAISYT